MPAAVRIWDLPTRLFHWLLAACVTGALVTVKLGGMYMDWHVRFGLATFGLILFRLLWGLFGPRYARFAQFVRGPGAWWRYLRGQAPEGQAGHNPLGALSVVAMLALFGLQAGTGLFANDDILTQGPLAHRISGELSSRLTGLHMQAEWLLYALVALHLAAVAWYALVRRKRLVGPMIHGDAPAAELAPGTPAAEDGLAVRLRALALAAAVAALLAWIDAQQAGAAGMYY
ncbi:cytochrome b/b6 domain-containing protein [Orrella sp. JC864]|uniref:cytochrome b/b6 domain-containing protein n=1 Tax=Orrella sp. JC864 TaxID=3120298 RepID=UPI0012BCC704